MVRLLFIVVPLVALAGCRTENLEFCSNPANAGRQGCAGDASNGGTCRGSGDCERDFPLCDTSLNGGTCVQCTTNDTHLCSGTTPICTNDQCTGCTKHADCPDSNVCLPNGSCAMISDVAYVDGTAGSDNTVCSKTMPCNRIEKAVMAKSIVKISGTVTNRCTLNDASATILADTGATLMPSDNGVALDIKGGSNLKIYDLTISTAKGTNAPDGTGISVSGTANVLLTRVTLTGNGTEGASVTGGQLSCSHCTVTGNTGHGIRATAGTIVITQSILRDNASGGIAVGMSAAFDIVGNIVYHNGQSDQVNAGGIDIQVNKQPNGASPNRLDFNSISDNMSAIIAGLSCMSVTPLTATNNIVYGNGTAGQVNVKLMPTDAACDYIYSDIGPVGISTSPSNMNQNPLYSNEATGDLHLTQTSPVQGQADPSTSLAGLAAEDIDDQPRVTRSGMGPDIGADQYYPPGKP